MRTLAVRTIEDVFMAWSRTPTRTSPLPGQLQGSGSRAATVGGPGAPAHASPAESVRPEPVIAQEPPGRGEDTDDLHLDGVDGCDRDDESAMAAAGGPSATSYWGAPDSGDGTGDSGTNAVAEQAGEPNSADVSAVLLGALVIALATTIG